MKQITIDGNMLADAEKCHDYLQEMLAFPEYYGKNLDALYDCLTDLEDMEITITLPEEGKEICQNILRVIRAAERENDALKIIMSSATEVE